MTMKHPGGRPRKSMTADAVPAQNYFTVGQAAELLGVHINTVRARLNDGTLKGKKLSGVWRIYPESLTDGKEGEHI